MRRRWLSTFLIAVASALVALGAGFALGRRGADGADGRTRRPDEGGPRVVRLGGRRAALSGLRAEPATSRRLARTLELVGSVDFDPDRVADVGSRIAGRVTRLHAGEGQHVDARQALAEIDGPELGDVIADLVAAHARRNAARTQLARQEALARQQLTTATVVEQARADAAALDGEARGAEQRLLAMGMSAEEIRGIASGRRPHGVTLRAPIAGEVVERQVVLGQVVDPTQPILRIADLSEVWVLLDVFERDLAAVRRGDAVAIESDTRPGQVMRGHVDLVASTIDVHTRTAQVRVRVPSPERALRPGQFVRARVEASGEATDAVALPREAVLAVDGEDTVFLARGGDAYEARRVVTGRVAGGLVEVVSGVGEGDRVVVSGGFALKSELAR